MTRNPMPGRTSPCPSATGTGDRNRAARLLRSVPIHLGRWPVALRSGRWDEAGSGGAGGGRFVPGHCEWARLLRALRFPGFPRYLAGIPEDGWCDYCSRSQVQDGSAGIDLAFRRRSGRKEPLAVTRRFRVTIINHKEYPERVV